MPAKPTVLLTGATGTIGRQLLPRLLSDHKVVVLGRRIDRFPEEIRFSKNFKFYEYDLYDTETPELSDKIHVLVHLASLVSDSVESSESLFEKNVLGTEMMLRLAKKNKIPRFIFTSSVSVYGHRLKAAVETSPKEGKSAYARSKINSENLIQESGIQYTILRLASVYGPECKSFINQLIRLSKLGIIPAPQNRETFKKSFIYMDDVVEALMRVIDKRDSGQSIYNLSHKQAENYSDILLYLKEHLHSNAFILPLNSFILFLLRLANALLSKMHKRKLDPTPFLYPTFVNPQKFIQDYKYNPSTNLSEGIRRIAVLQSSKTENKQSED